jgi:Glyoxalase/Bleomycin resistance protein/Dioxygenase superfamily
MSAEFDHIAIKVSDIEEFSAGLKGLGYSLQSSGLYDEVGMKIAFLGSESAGKSDKMELLEVIDPSSPIAADPDGLHHLAISVIDIEGSYKMMKNSSLYSVEGEIRQGAHCRIFFFRMAGSAQPLFECCEKAITLDSNKDNK